MNNRTKSNYFRLAKLLVLLLCLTLISTAFVACSQPIDNDSDTSGNNATLKAPTLKADSDNLTIADSDWVDLTATLTATPDQADKDREYTIVFDWTVTVNGDSKTIPQDNIAQEGDTSVITLESSQYPDASTILLQASVKVVVTDGTDVLESPPAAWLHVIMIMPEAPTPQPENPNAPTLDGKVDITYPKRNF